MAKPGVVPRVVEWLKDKWEFYPATTILTVLVLIGLVLLAIFQPGAALVTVCILAGIGLFVLVCLAAVEIFDL
ncbi:membrane protein [Microbacterium phage Cece]|nr:membrane protein [Microbacterium phage Cece]